MKIKSALGVALIVASLLTALWVVAGSIEAGGKERFSWSQPRVEIKLWPGATATVSTLTFTSTDALQNVTILPSSEISAFLRVRESPIATVVPNNPKALNLDFNIPSGTSKGAYAGFLIVASNGKFIEQTIALQIKVDDQQFTLLTESGSDSVEVNQGSSRNVVSTVTVSKPLAGPINVTNAATVFPSNGGITIVSDYPSGGYNTSAAGSTTFVLNQRFVGHTPGVYIVTNTSTITGSSPTVTSSDTITIEVLPPGGNPIILPVGSNPDGVRAGTPIMVTFTASISRFQSAPLQLSLLRLNMTGNTVTASMLDDGNGGDLQAGDGVYSANVLINESSEGLVKFKASGFFPGVPEERISPEYFLVVTDFPTKPVPGDPAFEVVDPSSGIAMLSNEVLVGLPLGTSRANVLSVISKIDGTVVGSLPGLGIYQVRITGDGTAQGVISAINHLNKLPNLTLVVPNVSGAIDEVAPSDGDYPLQYAPSKIRADEAWVITRGGPTVAIVDTGVDYNHPDLAGKVINGYDYANFDNDPMDDHSHGTHVAGIAAANSDNGVGVAGIAWNSRILAIKAFDSNGKGWSLLAAAGIKEAADSGAEIINCSFGYGRTGLLGVAHNLWYQKIFELAVSHAKAKGSIVVVSAGNEDTTVYKYPCLSDGSFCVGSTDQNDNRSTFFADCYTQTGNTLGRSSYGPAVDISAPGSKIWSTVLSGGYACKQGTSMAAPNLAGSVAVVWSYFPNWSAEQIIERLKKTAAPLNTDQPMGSGRVDLFEAVFNGKFGDDMNGWDVTGTAGTVIQLGSIFTLTDPPNRIAFLSSGPDSSQVQTTLEQSFEIQPGVTTFKLQFEYNFVTEEWPEFVGTGYNDNMRITLMKPDGTMQELAFESVNGSTFMPAGGIDFPGGDNTVGHTGFKPVNVTIPVTAGPGIYRIVVRDEGDGIYDSQVLIDNIRFK